MMPNIIASHAASLVSSPKSTSVGGHPARDWASGAGPSSAATRGCWRTSGSPCAMIGSASSSSYCFKARASSWLQNASLANSENRLLEQVLEAKNEHQAMRLERSLGLGR